MDWNEFPQAEGLSPSPAGRLVRLIHGLEQGQSPAKPEPIEQADPGESLMLGVPARSHLPSTRTQRSWLWRHPNPRTEGAVAISDQGRLARFVGRGEWDRPRWLLALTLLSMFVAGAAAVWIAWLTGGALGTTTERVTEHVWYVCVIWGAALVVLLVQAGRTIRIRA